MDQESPSSPPLPQNVVFGDPLGPVGVVAQTTITNWISVGPVTYVTPTFSILGSANGLGAFNWIGAKTKTGVEAQTGATSEVGAQSQVGAESRVGAKVDIGARFTAGAFTGPTQIRLDTTDAILFATKKSFDLPHPTKDGWRLRHVCLEGPSADIYIRGKTDKLTIDLPEYWTTFVDYDSITVTLTPLNGWQELFVKGIEGNKIHVRNNTVGSTYYSYTVYAERIDGEKLIPEYEGTSPDDYPGNSNEFVVNK